MREERERIVRKGEFVKEVEWLLRVEREREKELGKCIGKKVEAILEEWETRIREVVREEVVMAQADQCRRTEGRVDPGPVRKERRDRTRGEKLKPVRVQGERRPAGRGDEEFPPLRTHVVIRGGPERSYSESLRVWASVSLDALDIGVREGRECLVVSVGGEGSLAREIRGAAGRA